MKETETIEPSSESNVEMVVPLAASESVTDLIDSHASNCITIENAHHFATVPSAAVRSLMFSCAVIGLRSSNHFEKVLEEENFQTDGLQLITRESRDGPSNESYYAANSISLICLSDEAWKSYAKPETLAKDIRAKGLIAILSYCLNDIDNLCRVVDGLNRGEMIGVDDNTKETAIAVDSTNDTEALYTDIRNVLRSSPLSYKDLPKCLKLFSVVLNSLGDLKSQILTVPFPQNQTQTPKTFFDSFIELFSMVKLFRSSSLNDAKKFLDIILHLCYDMCKDHLKHNFDGLTRLSSLIFDLSTDSVACLCDTYIVSSAIQCSSHFKLIKIIKYFNHQESNWRKFMIYLKTSLLTFIPEAESSFIGMKVLLSRGTHISSSSEGRHAI
jgi:hypothetical protein